MNWLFYALLVLCMAASWFSDICNWQSVAVVSAAIVLGIFQDLRHFARPWFCRVIGVALFISLCYFDALQADGLQGRFLHLCLDMIWTLIGYRALSHSKSSERVQVGILALIPLVCVAYALPATQFLVFLLAYFLILFSGLAMQAMTPPTTGSCAGNQKRKIVQTSAKTPHFSPKGLLFLLFPILFGWALFFVVPRAGGNAANVPGLGTQTGAFPDVLLNRTGKIELDPSLVFRVKMPDKQGNLYWRVEVQNVFDGISWRSYYSTQTPPQIDLDPSQAYEIEFVREWRDHRMPALAQTQWMTAGYGVDDQKIRFYADNANAWHRFGWNRSNPLNSVLYWVQEENRYGALIESVWNRCFSAHHILQKNTPRNMIWPGRHDRETAKRLREFAEKIVGNASTDEEKADRISHFLQTNYAYSLERPPRENNVVEDFLFNQKFGHCEVFSTTMAVLLARLHVPVRNVTGFASSEYRDGYHLVRAAHAHSWVEVYLDNRWVVYDPTPSGAQKIQADWLLRIDDWFSSYQPRHLYEWVAKDWDLLATILAFLLGFFIISALPIRYLRRRLKPTPEVWRMAWNEMLAACRKNPSTRPLAMRTLESWWHVDSPELPEIQAFARQYIKARYGNPDETATGFRANCAIWRSARKAKKSLLAVDKRR